MSEALHISELEKELAQTRAQLTACLEFMVTEMHWEEFRAEMLYHDDLKKQNTSEENARKLRNFLVAHRQEPHERSRA